MTVCPIEGSHHHCLRCHVPLEYETRTASWIRVGNSQDFICDDDDPRRELHQPYPVEEGHK